MNVTLKNPMKNKTTDVEEVIKITAENLIKTRPICTVKYLPYVQNPALDYYVPVHRMDVDLFKLHKTAKEGEFAYCVTDIFCETDCDIFLNLAGKVEVWFEKQFVYSFTGSVDSKFDTDKGNALIPVSLKKGYNNVIIKCVCEKDYFGFMFLAAQRDFAVMWAKEYLCCVRATMPIKDFRGEDGFAVSRLFDKETSIDEIEYVFPNNKQIDLKEFDFNNYYKNGYCAYAYSVAQKDMKLDIKSDCKIKIFINGSETKDKSADVNRGDCVLIKCVKSDNWKFKINNINFAVPFLQAATRHGTDWLITGGFGNNDNDEIAYAPEQNLQFEKPYLDVCQNRVFWRFRLTDTYLRLHLDSIFFSQWCYPLMVGQYGLLQAALALNAKKYFNYFIMSMKSMAKYFDYIQYDYKTFGDPAFMARSVMLDNWDNIGTIGINMIEAYKYTNDENIRRLTQHLSSQALKHVDRFDDGTFNRTTTMWADDVFMSCPFLVRMAKIETDTRFYDEVVTQIKGYKKRLYMPEKQIFSHIYFVTENKPNKIPWGRGNGWIFFALSEILQIMPENTQDYDFLLKLFKEFAKGICNVQDECGLWHQVLDIKSSYLESSCSAMFLLGICRGVKNGWLGDDYKSVADKAYDGLISLKLDENGNLYNVCKGSGLSMEADYYCKLESVTNDDHGTGVLLAALSEYKMLK